MLLDEKSNHKFYLIVNITGYKNYFLERWYNSGMKVLGVTNHFLTGLRPVPQDGIYVCYHVIKAKNM